MSTLVQEGIALVDVDRGVHVLFRSTSDPKKYLLLSKVSNNGKGNVVMEDRRKARATYDGTMTCHNVLIDGKQYVLALCEDDCLRRWELPV